MRDVLMSAAMFTGFAGAVAAFASCAMLVATGVLFPAIGFVAGAV